MKKLFISMCIFCTLNVFGTNPKEKEPTKIVIEKEKELEDDRTSDILEAYENDVTLSIYPYLSISNATVIISGNGVVDRYSLSLGANQLQEFNIGGYNEGNYLLQIILPDGEILSGDFMIE